jgi:hypothetical protein
MAASCLGKLEQALADGVIGQRQQVLRAALGATLAELQSEAARMLHVRRRDLAEQMQELKGLEGKNVAVVRHMRSRVDRERVEFEQGGARIHAVRSVHLRLLREVFRTLGGRTLSAELAVLIAALTKSGLKLGAKKAYTETFDRLRAGLAKAQAGAADIQSMLSASFRQLNAEQGFSLQAPSEFDLTRFGRDLDLIERNHHQYMSLGNSLRLASSDNASRLVRALRSRLRIVYESALAELELWSKSATSQLDFQLAERQKNFSRRIETIERVQHAELGLTGRMTEIEAAQLGLDADERMLQDLCQGLLATGQGQHLAAIAADAPAFNDSDMADFPLDVSLNRPSQRDSLPAFLQEA